MCFGVLVDLKLFSEIESTPSDGILTDHVCTNYSILHCIFSFQDILVFSCKLCGGCPLISLCGKKIEIFFVFRCRVVVV